MTIGTLGDNEGNGTMPAIYLASDSTCQDYPPDKAPQAGWGQFIQYELPGRNFVNRAIGGRSSKTFVEEGRLEQILSEIRSGDYLFIQMGHNDATSERPERYTEPQTTYKQYLQMYIEGARSRGGIPVLITPMGRLHYVDGRFLNDFEPYCTAMKELAEAKQVPLIDLMELSLSLYTRVGYEEAKSYFMISTGGTDCTHFTQKGAREIAGLVAKGISEHPMLHAL